MSKKTIFEEIKEKHYKTLELYTPIVAKVHGGSHPEFHDVHKLFNIISEKIKEAGKKKPVLDEEFIKLREITNDYAIPEDVCESYEAVYKILAQLDEAYFS